ncbi:glycyl-radical enzyme activating protein [Clostridium uliginosum]|uniref:Pyruvate formate lyase activating enzyme n=1 Tax=Clostridium uliginosum TaxID=119641 RepID=A0A1I1NBM4_9CLOT|nr:glycyl-radical enzyme activating protein [Clostridium uliginosum]SFC91140.1 pyruvate formate lyase activating enzyme [Clostridium uliginosum]
MLKDEINYNEKGIIFNIQRFSVNDGPGVRTIVFLKGCPLSCRWCSNPESQNTYKEVMFNIKNCTGCHKCGESCKIHAIDFNLDCRIDRDKCINCGECIESCYPGALVMSGEEMSVNKVIEEVKKDSIQFRHSNGGVTLSGGEPLMQPKFALELLKACKAMGLHTTIETTGYSSKDVVDEIMPWVDLVLLDIKTTDSAKHLEYIGKSNEIILENAKKISELGVDIIIRVPVIPGFNADSESIKHIAEFARCLKKVNEVNLLPYHKLGVNKYECIGKDYKMKNELNTPSDEFMLELKEIVEDLGLKCNVGAH